MSRLRTIDKIAVIGSGTMGMGIAALCAQAGYPVVLLDINKEQADQAVERMLEGRNPALDDASKKSLIETGSIETDLGKLADADWICEAIVENLDRKRELFNKLESVRKTGSILSTNTSGIPLRDITEGMPQDMRADVAVTHFFNPVKVMRLLELVPGEDTQDDVITTLADFCTNKLGKGVVYAKDTVNFIGNRIGCYWILAGLHLGKAAREKGLDIETMDALIAGPLAMPPTALYGLVDLIGLDVMDLVAKNMGANLPAGDPGLQYCQLPAAEQKMLDAGQLGRKSGGGYYRMQKLDDGSKRKEVFEMASGSWRPAREIRLSADQQDLKQLIFSDSDDGRFIWQLMLETCIYAADLVPEIADDIVNIDRAMVWGFGWPMGPFQFLDSLGADKVIARLQKQGKALPVMLQVLQDADATSFYAGENYLGRDGMQYPLARA